MGANYERSTLLTMFKPLFLCVKGTETYHNLSRAVDIPVIVTEVTHNVCDKHKNGQET